MGFSERLISYVLLDRVFAYERSATVAKNYDTTCRSDFMKLKKEIFPKMKSNEPLRPYTFSLDVWAIGLAYENLSRGSRSISHLSGANRWCWVN